MSSPQGRPRREETRLRTREFLHLVAAGEPPHKAARKARVKPDRIVRLLGEPGFRRALCQLLEDAA